MRFSLLCCVLLCAVALAAAQQQQFHPQPQVLGYLNYQAVGATIFLKPDVYVNQTLSGWAKKVSSMFHLFVDELTTAVPDAKLNAGIGFSAGLWQQWGTFLPMPKGLFDFPGYTGPNGWPTMPKTGGEIFIHAKASRRDVLYTLVSSFVEELSDHVVEYLDVIESWQNIIDGANRDLTGYIDGSVNAPVDRKAEFALIGSEDKYHVNGSFAIAQRWVHNLKAFRSLNETQQNDVFGRTKLDSKELPNPKPTAHFVRVDQDLFGYFLVRQAMPWGDAMTKRSGLFFIAYTSDAHRLDAMCRSMVGWGTFATPAGHVDEIMKFSDAVANNYYYFPSMEVLNALGNPSK